MSKSSLSLLSPSGRLKLIPPTAEDDEATSILRSDPVAFHFLQFFPAHISVDEVRLRREHRAKDESILDFNIHQVKDDGSSVYIGSTGIFHIEKDHKSCECGIVTSPNRQRSGIATEALYTLLDYVFGDYGMHRVTFETAEENQPMRRWLENVLGAKQEALRRECWRERGGRYVNVASYSILDWEWRNGAKAKLAKLIVT